MKIEEENRNQIPSPDILIHDRTGNYYVEVNMFSDDGTSEFIMDELRSFLATFIPRCRVDVSLPTALSIPACNYMERGVKESKIREILVKFKEKIRHVNRQSLPTRISVDDVIFNVSDSNFNIGYPGLINTNVFKVPTQEFVRIIQYRVGEKAKKRLKWMGDNLRNRYIIAIDSDQILMGEDELLEALIGSGHFYQPPLRIPQRLLPTMITNAAIACWRQFLESVHLIPLGQTVILE